MYFPGLFRSVRTSYYGYDVNPMSYLNDLTFSNIL